MSVLTKLFPLSILIFYIINQMCKTILHPNPLGTLNYYKIVPLERPASETCTQSHGDMIIMSGKADKQRKLLANVNVSLPLGARQIM